MSEPIDLEVIRQGVEFRKGRVGGVPLDRTIEALIAEVERLREDKARLDWLGDDYDRVLMTTHDWYDHGTGTFREAIDAARAKEGVAG
jgi:hypothetical protein